MLSGKNVRILIIIFVVLIMTLFAVVLGSGITNMTPPAENTDNKPDVVEVIDSKTGKKYTFYRDGLVIYTDEKGNTVSEAWQAAKMASFLDYIETHFSADGSGIYQVTLGGVTGSVGSGGDELISVATGGESGSGGSGSGGSITQYFASPTPIPSYVPFVPETPPPAVPPPVIPSWCIHWKLSYCTDLAPDTPTPSPTGSYPPGVIEAKDCSEWTFQSLFKTVISNSSCYQLEE